MLLFNHMRSFQTACPSDVLIRRWWVPRIADRPRLIEVNQSSMPFVVAVLVPSYHYVRTPHVTKDEPCVMQCLQRELDVLQHRRGEIAVLDLVIRISTLDKVHNRH